MREIKYQAFDGKECRNVISMSLMLNGSWDILLEGGGRHTSDFWPLREFTGLHDKNGREIYEGDIIRVPIAKGVYREPVFFEGGAFCARGWKDFYGRELPTPIIEFSSRGWYIEVMGNIYENPELLEQP